MKKPILMLLSILVISVSFILAESLLTNHSRVTANAGLCDDAADKGVCKGTGVKCTIDRILRCQKDKDGAAIEIDF